MSRFFIDRPIFAWVIAIVIMLAGILSLRGLPVSMYPQIAPPAVVINASYPGASAKTVEDSVTQVIEQKMTGLDGLLYMSSSSDSNGSTAITLTFRAGTNVDIAQVQTQNKLQLALPLLPQAVQQQGVRVNKATSDFLMVVGFISEDGKLGSADLSDYVVTNLQEPLSRVPGVGDVQVFGSQYAMRIWLDPSKLLQFKLVPADVRTAIQAQNAQVSAGQLGGLPAVEGQQLNATVTSQSRLQTPEQFGNILLVTRPDGSTVRLRDVARIEIGAETYATTSRFNGTPSAGVAIRLAPGANALDTATAVKSRLNDLQANFPAGMKWVIGFDTTDFIKVSIEEVVKTLVEAVVLVFLVMFLFLQNWRATLVPTIAIPVVLLGTMASLSIFGFSINTLTMFALVLAIGLLVDDAIVVVENVERLIHDEHLSPREATRKSMQQITGALIGIALVLTAVFVPMAFFGGSTGVIYRQFSITIVSAMALSVLVALILTPALTASLLKETPEKGHHMAKGGFFGWFNRSFDRAANAYQRNVGHSIRKPLRYLAIYVAVIGAMVLILTRLPTAFLPEEDQGILFTQLVLPAGATQERTLDVIKQVENHFLNTEKDNVEAMFAVAGFSFGGSGQNTGIAFVKLRNWDQRPGAARSAQAVAGRAMAAFSRIKDAMVFAFAPPSVPGLGTSSGFTLQLQDRGNLGHDGLLAARNMLLGLAMKEPGLMGVRPNGQEDTPQFQLEIDSAKAGALGLTMAAVNDTLATAWGGQYIDDFIDRSRLKRVYLQADARARMVPEDLGKWHVRNASGQMVPLSSFASGKWTYGSPRLERYNGVPTMQLQGSAAPGGSSGEAMATMERLVAQVQQQIPGIGYEWTSLSYEERQSGAQAPLLYALSLLVVFLCLAALYESWSVPFSVMLIVPAGIFGVALATLMRGLENDVYFQVGLLTIIGLSSKNAILIVEFAKGLYEQGEDLVKATLHAARLRLRPIIMTSLAFGFGVLPLAISSGAGAGSRHAVGTGVLGGMLAATLLGVFLVPLFFVLVRRRFPGKRAVGAPPAADAAAPATTGQVN
ncbi:MAG: efflux RND transporter permease subunit [Burkholderiaceae bacterium]|jgi:multidrug efflux pump|nr:efflux RND transporter permease subunit [Burkholderiaceae bacterium]